MLEPTLPGAAAGFDDLCGLRILDVSTEEVRGELPVQDGVRQPFGLVHGGVLAGVAESLATAGTALGIGADETATGFSSQTSFLRPIFAGTVHACARRRHRGRTTWVWEIDVTDDDGRLCALVRMTIGVTPSTA